MFYFQRVHSRGIYQGSTKLPNLPVVTEGGCWYKTNGQPSYEPFSQALIVCSTIYSKPDKKKQINSPPPPLNPHPHNKKQYYMAEGGCVAYLNYLDVLKFGGSSCLSLLSQCNDPWVSHHLSEKKLNIPSTSTSIYILAKMSTPCINFTRNGLR